MIESYGRKDGLKGLEAEYEFKGEELYIKIEGTNSFIDGIMDILAWPRKKYNSKKIHRFWFKQSEKFANFLKTKKELKKVKTIVVIGHSMGGANASLLPLFMPNKKFIISLINSPKVGNKILTDWLHLNSDLIAFYDKGDIVRHLPLFYHKFYKNKEYDRTRPFWKAHANFPKSWTNFFKER